VGNMVIAWDNKLYFGDNLTVLREEIPGESIDLIYLDPPFNSQATFYVAVIVKPFGALFSFFVSPASLLVRMGLGCAHTGSVCE
jgi:hypothetical protein